MKCCFDTCDKAATHAPKVFVPAQGYAAVPQFSVSCIFGIQLCENHARDFEAKEQFNDPRTSEQWRSVFNAILSMKRSGRVPVPLDFKRAFNEALSLESIEYIQYEAMQAKRN